MVSKEQFSKGITRFLQEEVVDKVPDASVKLMVGTLVFAMKRNPNLVCNYIDSNELLRTILSSDGYEYDVDGVIEAMSDSIQAYGNIKLTLPRVPLLLPNDATICFSRDDLVRLKEHIEHS